MSKKAYIGIGMNGIIAKWYTKLTFKDYEQYRELAGRLRKVLTGEKAILEVAPGPGFLAIELAKELDFKVTGMDISETFVQIASKRAEEAEVNAQFVVDNVSKMPFQEAQFDFIVCRAAFKNFAKPVEAIQEMFRVLKPGGKALIIDMRSDISDETIDDLVNQMEINRWNRLVTTLTFKYMLRKRAYSLAEIRQLSVASKFKTYQIDTTATGFDLWLEK
jgi:Methylase involved in ubiquinone/menaquinone biosynthesis